MCRERIGIKTGRQINATAHRNVRFERRRARKAVTVFLRATDHRPRSKDISIVMTSFFMKCVGFWVANDRAERRRIKFAFVYTVLLVFVSAVILFHDLYHIIGDTNECFYITANILCLFLVLWKICILQINRKDFIELIQHTQKHFWHSNYDPYETSVLMHCKNTCILFIFSFTFFTQCAVYVLIVSSIAENFERNATDRILPIRMWIDLPLSLSPYFEIVSTMQVFIILHIAICYFCFDNLLCLMNVHAIGQFRILHYRLIQACTTKRRNANDPSTKRDSSSYVNEYYMQFKNCIKQHQALIEYCRKLDKTFTINILGQILVFDVLMCLAGYQILVANVNRGRQVSYVFHLMGSFCELLMFTYSCDGIIEESGNVATAAYSGLWATLPFTRTGKMLRQDLKFVIMKSRRYCCLTAGGFFPVSLQTYTMILSTAMSYFTLLKQAMGS